MDRNQDGRSDQLIVTWDHGSDIKIDLDHDGLFYFWQLAQDQDVVTMRLHQGQLVSASFERNFTDHRLGTSDQIHSPFTGPRIGHFLTRFRRLIRK